MAKKKTCFVIAPIGAPDSPERRWSDTIFEHIIKPSVEPDYKPIRADQIEQSGLVTAQIVDQLLNADLTIADLTDGNPNVYYEVAIRHAVKKPIVHLIKAGQKPKFDIQGMRAVHVDDSLGIGKNAIESIKAQVKTLESDPNSLTTPVSQAINLAELNRSDAPADSAIASIDKKLTQILMYVGEEKHVFGKHGRVYSRGTDDLSKLKWEILVLVSAVPDGVELEKIRQELDAKNSPNDVSEALNRLAFEDKIKIRPGWGPPGQSATYVTLVT